MVGPLDRALILSGRSPRRRPEALHLNVVLRRAQIEEGVRSGARFFDGKGKELTVEQALATGGTLVILEPDN